MAVFGAGQRVILAYPPMPGRCAPPRRGGLNARASLIHSGEGTTMRFIKAGMAIAAVCAAMLSMTMIVKRKRQGQQGRRPRA